VMFLLVTAVWNELARIDAQLNTPGDVNADQLSPQRYQLLVSLSAQGYVLSSTAGEHVEIPLLGAAQDVVGLCAQLDVYRKAHPNDASITVAADDGIAFEALIATLDAVRSRGFAITL
jgi:hypothetical protein